MADDTEARSRLVVELNTSATADLQHLLDTEGVNKTLIVHRALHLYRLVQDTSRDGGRVFLQDAGSKELQRLLLL